MVGTEGSTALPKNRRKANHAVGTPGRADTPIPAPVPAFFSGGSGGQSIARNHKHMRHRLAFVASRITPRPSVTTMVDHFCAAFGMPSQQILAECDMGTDEALSRLVSTLSTAAAQELLAQLGEALSERELLWRNVFAGTEDAMQDLPPPLLRHARGIIL